MAAFRTCRDDLPNAGHEKAPASVVEKNEYLVATRLQKKIGEARTSAPRLASRYPEYAGQVLVLLRFTSEAASHRARRQGRRNGRFARSDSVHMTIRCFPWCTR